MPYLQIATEVGQECDWRACFEIRIQILLELRWHYSCEVGEDPRSNVNLTQHVHLLNRQTL